ncbi:MAG: hypothetical protein F6K23_15095 [Okeania sp. SIO2C9]|uniref:hypothetical protein n=1 Tax=Okeania sp. SIO2C9 TaxID=2607791 RepID=UPI0013C07D31|nr:hypothetical protein [Okeania sp. SIO2C9]NEQ74247.1 hypothetical protein [Okeania sp. SIO2C9]
MVKEVWGDGDPPARPSQEGNVGRWGVWEMGRWGVWEKFKNIYPHHYHAGLPSFEGSSQVGEPSDWRRTGVRRKNSYKDFGHW